MTPIGNRKYRAQIRLFMIRVFPRLLRAWEHPFDTHLGNGEAVLEVDVLALDVTVDDVGLGVAGTGDLEGNVGGSEGLDLKGGTVDGVVLEEQVRRGLAEVLRRVSSRSATSGCLEATAVRLVVVRLSRSG